MPAHARSAAHGPRGTRSGCHTRGRGAAERRNLRAGWGRPARRAGGPRRPRPPPTAGRRAAGRPARGTTPTPSRLPSRTAARNAGHGSHRASPTSSGSARDRPGRGADEHRAHLVLHDAVLLGAVAEARQHQPQVGDGGAELLLDAAAYGVLERLAGRGVAAAAVGPHAGEGALVQRPLGHQHVARVVEEVAREGQVQRGVGVVDARLVGGADGAARPRRAAPPARA